MYDVVPMQIFEALEQLTKETFDWMYCKQDFVDCDPWTRLGLEYI